MVTEGTNPQYLGEFTEHTYVSPKTSYKSLFMEEPIMGRGPGSSKRNPDLEMAMRGRENEEFKV